jgi:von Willebrand factor type A domain
VFREWKRYSFFLKGMKVMRFIKVCGWALMGAFVLSGVGCGSDGDEDDQNGDGDAVGAIDLGDGDGDADGDGKNRNRIQGCNDLEVEFETISPTVMVLVDRSSSMFDQGFADFPNRWDPLKEALVGDDGVVTKLQGGVRFGFSAYTHQSKNGAGSCPIMDVSNFDVDNLKAIKTLYDTASSDPIVTGVDGSKGETPTGAAVSVATKALEDFEGFGPKFLLVVTDGEPDTCSEPDPQCGQDEAIAAVQAAHEKGIGTFVIGVGEIGVNHLQDLANAGLGLPVAQRGLPDGCQDSTFDQGKYSANGGDARVFNPADPAALKADIAGIVGRLRGCSYIMSEEVDPEKAHLGTVFVNDETAVHDDENGWRMNSATELELLGSSCEAIKTVIDPDVFISFPCDVFVK